MRGASTGRDPSPQAPESAGTVPMNSSENVAPGPESTPGQTAAGVESPDVNPTAPSPPTSSAVASPSSSAEPAQNNETPKKNHLLIPIPSRRSSKASKTDKQPVSEKTEDPGQAEPARRGSKVSILKVRRDRSRASSRRSRRGSPDAPKVEKPRESTADAATPTTPDMNGHPPPAKKRGLFGFLSCCSSGVDGDDEPPVPPKASNKEPAPARLATPDKTEVNAGDSSTAESKEPAYYDEKSNAISNEDSSHAQKAPSIADVQSEGQSAGTQPDSSAKEKEDQIESVKANGVATESKADGPSSEDQTSAPEPVPAEVTSKKLGDSAEDAPSHEENEVIHSAPVLPPPPPPPLPVPNPPSVSDRDDGQWLLPPAVPALQGRKCLVLDLDETLVHSSFKVLERADFTIPVEIEGQYHNIYVIKRPGVDQFMKRVGELYEVVVFTASVSKYGDPLLDQLDIHNVVHHRLFRESCYNHQGNYVKDLSQVGRDLKDTIIIDNSPTSYIFHPQHAIPISSWFSDAHDNELLDLIPVLEDLAGAQVQDVSMVLDITL
ncbi:hypothetical protein N7468_000937 [Penicillium chermesinum]|uniref:FCP1 homology domain-containing protein n=1 Tax=Penicillium chermesinum TaxID=63820 RepID=A0A9W9PFX3_9EURO|nr:uncharacterized protein N7468_000937 [Penicillium chermesinum]KAJ5245954.1 hypothetical protein N7468_000937 [Penicillium chermesinum]